MTDTCLTCNIASFPNGTTSPGYCRLNPPNLHQVSTTVDPDDWCAQFSSSQIPLGWTSISATAPVAGGYFLFALRSDGAVYASTNGGAWSAYATLPALP